MAASRSPLVGILVGLAVLALVAVPAFFSATAAVAGFAGCLFECSEPEPDPAVGALWTGLTLVLLALPVAAGLATVRVGSVRGWLLLAAVGIVALVAYLVLQGVV